MLIQLFNFGPIKEFKIDLNKDLSFIYGKNNIGKSYAIMVIYLILKNLVSLESMGFHASSQYLFRRRPIGKSGQIRRAMFVNREPQKEKAMQLLENRIATSKSEISIKSEVEAIMRDLIQGAFVIELEESLATAFSEVRNMANKLTKEPMRIAINFESIQFDIMIKDKHLVVENLAFKRDLYAKKVKVHRKLKDDKLKDRLIFYLCDHEAFEESLNAFAYRTFFYDCINETTDVCQEVYFLPASRSGLYQALNAFSQIIAELAKKRSFLTTSIELPGISAPVSDYFLRLSDINTRQKAEESIVKSAVSIEERLLNGEVTFDGQSKKILYRPSKLDIVVEMSAASSMVAEISPIVLYLKHVIGNDVPKRKREGKSLIFIEEPEAHLHPEAQVILMEIFAQLINSGLKMIITSHSNYMFNKLNNLILSGDVDLGNISTYLLALGPEGSIGKQLEMDNLGVEDHNFSETAERLYNESLKLIDQMNGSLGEKID